MSLRKVTNFSSPGEPSVLSAQIVTGTSSCRDSPWKRGEVPRNKAGDGGSFLRPRRPAPIINAVTTAKRRPACRRLRSPPPRIPSFKRTAGGKSAPSTLGGRRRRLVTATDGPGAPGAGRVHPNPGAGGRLSRILATRVSPPPPSCGSQRATPPPPQETPLPPHDTL